MATTQIVLVDKTHSLDVDLLHSAAVALDTQVSEHLTQYWSGITASVTAAPTLSSVPDGAWPVFLVKTLPPGEGGFHLDKNNQPYAKVIASARDDTWTIDASHEIIEMLVDPFGNRMQSSQAIAIADNAVVDASGTFNYLVEACDPCEANNFAYDINGIAVSDFITPNFYDAVATSGTAYSFMRNITRPRQLLQGGYISYVQPDGKWNQILWVDPAQPPQYANTGEAASVRSLREAFHARMGDRLNDAKHAQRRNPEGLPPKLAARLAVHKERRLDKSARAARIAAWYELRD